MNGRSYPAYRDLEGCWRYPNASLYIDHVQSDPFAPPSKLRLHVDHTTAQFPPSLYSTPTRTIALCDYLTRVVSVFSSEATRSKNWHGAKGGYITIDTPGQQVLQRSSITLDGEAITVLFTYGFPAQGRTILGEMAAETFRTVIPQLINSLPYKTQDKHRLQSFVESIEDQEFLREEMKRSGLVAFVANGAILPRASGASDLPMTNPEVVKFQSPVDLECTFILPNRGEIKGMGVPAGITLIAGGGFHGKSTLLNALAVGCYNHIPGDGREFVVTSASCVSIKGDEGRSIKSVDISPFINNLPGNVSTTDFSTQNASGSTSMAAGVMEALELGADTLLFDEDTCATNFLIRDKRMQRLIEADPITPLVFKVRSLFNDHKASSILVIGGCGDYCDVADLVLEMREYRCHNVTDKAMRIAAELPSAVAESESESSLSTERLPRLRCLDASLAKTFGRSKATARGRTSVQVGEEPLDLSALVQIVHDSQTRAIAGALRRFASHGEPVGLASALRQLQEIIDRDGLHALDEEGHTDGFLARPRLLELGMAVDRMSTVTVYSLTNSSYAATTECSNKWRISPGAIGMRAPPSAPTATWYSFSTPTPCSATRTVYDATYHAPYSSSSSSSS
ncbi:hypothetical protein GLOTRDRAFT_112790 [Gloeophyllum trabeum ATCC 11539]|uniref:P-loop containing nucleoside triphosphate hydrolase protein n=1 Tax=Gloeophyllum trabeum (strain ATCC 11539 / FP-39264 / Madison 617) TaxID=670483 RepID=S7S2I5_GLOTA|nr:uncharacterized protein GLOTRDRAFT_112790 [Gloeophyllum trabeum ATCC 11539]EPQ59969.1 hypothetical protein GLOTRDRAFT_112790 [Gloeophyllum trabeum ATCC 11539]